ncbi:integral membrane protein mmpl5 [Rhodococcus gordoniae]|uniref:Integral membrane protein mmpl5 n=1 Tax=Rhodococcus gordoniae TaxID=223392 RepID=A0A379LZN7_9NOCA|nr:MMPL family transporter [Rhodococcus gordoniae]SUE15544.1 integral membrane protein mmpl5 [Rhodococcus gordoniae]
MFDRWGELVYRARFTVIAVMVAGLLALAGYGLSLNDHLSQSGWDDPGSESVAAAKLADGTFGRDTAGDVLVLYTAPEGRTVDDPEFAAKVTDSLNSLVAEHPDEILKINGAYWPTDDAPSLPSLADPSRQHAIASVAIAGEDDTELTGNFREVKDEFAVDGIDVQLAGLQPISGALNDTMANDIKRMEILAIPAVGILLFFVFGGVVAAALPLITGGLTIVAANGIVRLITNFTEVNSFVAPVVSLIGLGLAIDYGLFMVSRFREELAEGYDTRAAVRRTVVTAGRTVVFSATMVVTSLGGLVLFPQGFLKSVAYGAISAVSLAALLSITILPAILSILGKRIDKFGMKRFGQIQSNEQVENSFLGRLCRWVMVNPMKVTIPTVIGLLLLIMPLTGIKFGGINETYLPPEHPTRVAQETFDELFPGQRAEPVKLVVRGAEGGDLNKIITTASEAPGLVEKFTITGPAKDGVRVLKAGLTDRNESADTIEYLHAAEWPEGVEVLVGGTPAIEQDSIAALLDTLPLMVVVVVLLTTLLMFLAFGSLVLPVKAVLMSALGLGSTLGILTWIFIDGHGAGLLNFTPGPIMSPVLVLIIAIVYGLSTDYEVFLLSRMVEARSMGASTTESIRIGTAHTGRIITAAALILIVVTGAFGFSELVMMKYIAFGMIAALIIDATVIRMFLVPAVMKLLGDDCWWAPAWMKRIQEKIGLGEPILADELMPQDVPELITVGMFGPATVAATGAHRFPGAFEGGSDLTQPLPKIAPPRPASEQRKLRDLTPPPVRRQAPGRPPVRPAAPAAGRPPAPRNGERVPPATGRPTPASRPAPPAAGPGRPSRPVPEPRRRAEDRTQVDERNGMSLPQRGALDPTQRGALDPTQRGALDPTQRGASETPGSRASEPSPTSAVPPLPRRQRGEVPPPLPQSFVRPPVVPGDSEPLPGAPASRPRESGTARGRDPQAIENWLSQLRRTSPGGEPSAPRRRPAQDGPRPPAREAQRSPAPEPQRPSVPEAQRPPRSEGPRLPAPGPARPPVPGTQQPPTQGMQPPTQSTPRPPLPSRSRGPEQPPRSGGAERPEQRADDSQQEQNDADSRSRGRHGPDGGRSISVSELIARQRRD